MSNIQGEFNCLHEELQHAAVNLTRKITLIPATLLDQRYGGAHWKLMRTAGGRLQRRSAQRRLCLFVGAQDRPVWRRGHERRERAVRLTRPASQQLPVRASPANREANSASPATPTTLPPSHSTQTLPRPLAALTVTAQLTPCDVIARPNPAPALASHVHAPHPCVSPPPSPSTRLRGAPTLETKPTMDSSSPPSPTMSQGTITPVTQDEPVVSRPLLSIKPANASVTAATALDHEPVPNGQASVEPMAADAQRPKEALTKLLNGKEKEWTAIAEKKGPIQLLDLPVDILKAIIDHVREHPCEAAMLSAANRP